MSTRTDAVHRGPSSIRVRSAATDDLDWLMAQSHDLAALHRTWDARRFAVPDPHATRAFVAASLADPQAAVWIAERGGARLGYAIVAAEGASALDLHDGCAWLHELYVAPDARNGGLGAALLSRCIAWTGERGLPQLLLAVAPSNGAAQARFARHGFRATLAEMARATPGAGSP